jgi:hypothetical protein
LQVLKDRAAEGVLALLGHVGEELAVALDDEAGQPLSRSASASQVSSLPLTRTFVGAGGGVVSGTAVSLTYCIHARATARSAATRPSADRR